MNEFGIILAGFLTLCIFSFLYKDNPFYRLAEHIYVGVSFGYLSCRSLNDVFFKKLYGPLFHPAPGVPHDLYLILPLFLSVLMIMKLFPSVSWVSRWAIAFVVGGTIGLSMTARFKSDVVLQVKGTIQAFQAKEKSPEKRLAMLKVHQSRLTLFEESHKSNGSTPAGNLASADTMAPLNKIALNYRVLSSMLEYLRTEIKSSPDELFGKNPERFSRLTSLFLEIPPVFKNLDSEFKSAVNLLRPMIKHHKALLPILERAIAAREATISEYLRVRKTDGQATKKVIDELHTHQQQYLNLQNIRKTMIDDQVFLKKSFQEYQAKVEEGIFLTSYTGVKDRESLFKTIETLMEDITRHQYLYTRLTKSVRIFNESYTSLTKIGLRIDRFQEMGIALDYMKKAENIIRGSLGKDELTLQSLKVTAQTLKEKMKAMESEAKASTEGLDSLNIAAFVPEFNQTNQRFDSHFERFQKAELKKPFDGQTKDFINAFLIACAVVTILVYFFFSTEHKGVVGVAATAGIYFLMVSFGASFGYTIMARISLLIGRMDFLLNVWGKTILQLAGWG